MRLLAFLLASAALPAQQYFPPSVLPSASQYSKYLKAMREPSLWELAQRDSNAEVYRFLWLRSFHHPIAIRVVVRSNGSGWMNARMTSGRGGAEPGGIRRYSTSWLRKGLTLEWLAMLESTHFWHQPSLLDTNSPPDGAHWIFEGVRNGQYHVIDRWSPAAGDPVRTAGVLALKFARFKIRPAEVY